VFSYDVVVTTDDMRGNLPLWFDHSHAGWGLVGRGHSQRASRGVGGRRSHARRLFRGANCDDSVGHHACRYAV